MPFLLRSLSCACDPAYNTAGPRATVLSKRMSERWPSHSGTPLDAHLFAQMALWETWYLPEVLLGFQPGWSPPDARSEAELRKMRAIVDAANHDHAFLRGADGHVPFDAKIPPDGHVYPEQVIQWVRRKGIHVAAQFAESPISSPALTFRQQKIWPQRCATRFTVSSISWRRVPSRSSQKTM